MLRLGTSALMIIGLCAAASAGPIGSLQGDGLGYLRPKANVPVDGTWIVLDEIMSVGAFYAPIFTFTSPTPIQIDVTDLFVVSDRNEVYLDGILLGVTPAMPDWQFLTPAVGPLDDPPFTTDPAVAWLRPEFSKQSFALPAGTHMLSLRNVHIPLDPDGNPYADGTVAFRLIPEPGTALLLVTAAAAFLTRRRGRSLRCWVVRGAVAGRTGLAVAALALFATTGPAARAGTPCGLAESDIVGGVLEIVGTPTADSVRVMVSAGDPFVVEVYTPVTAVTPACTYDAAVTPFATIRVLAGDGDDLVVFDDSNGVLANTWTIEIDGGGGDDTVFGGIDLSAIPLGDALLMIDALQDARDLIDRALDLLDESPAGCASVPCLADGAATAVRSAGADLVLPTAQYVRDIEGELVQPTAAAVKEARDRIAGYLQTFVASDVQGLTAEAEAFTANVEVMVDEFELLLPVAQSLLVRAQTLYDRAASLGLATQSGDPATLFMTTVESHVLTIAELAEMCDEDPEPTETEFDENLQDPSGLPPICAEVERRTEALEAITDGVEAAVDGVEAEGDVFENDADALAAALDALGDDENAGSAAAQLEQQGEQLVVTADALAALAENLNADWEQWVAQVEADLETRGDLMDARGHAEVRDAADALHAQVDADVVAAADALRAEAEQMLTDLQALLTVAAPLLRDDLAAFDQRGDCTVNPVHTLLGGPGNDILIGTTGSDLIDGGDGADLIVGAGGADRLLGRGGNDLIFGGGGADEIRGGADVDLLVGNAGDDCLFGGGGQTLTRGSLTVELGDLFFGLDGNDVLASGDDVDDELVGMDVAFGGAGDDLIRVSHGGTLTVGSFSFQFGNLVFGGPGADDTAAQDGVDVIFGDGGDDTVVAGRGAALTIGSGSSAFRLALGDLVFGGDGADTLHGDDPDADRADDDIDLLFGGRGDDQIHGYGGGLLSVGDVSNPDFELRLGNLVFGGSDDDHIVTLDGIDVLFGGDGDDTLIAGRGALLALGSGNSAFRLALGDLLFGGDGADVLHGDDPAADRDDDDIDVIFGADGPDIIRGYSGGLLSIGDPDEPTFELRLGNVIFGGAHDDDIATLAGIDLNFAGAGDDTVAAGDGAALEIDDDFRLELGDLIFGQSGADTLHGDTATAAASAGLDGIDLIFGGPGPDRIYGGAGGALALPEQDFCLQFGNLLFGGPDEDLLRGDYADWNPDNPRGGIDLIFGAAGDDVLEGSGGSLIVIGDLTSGQTIIIPFGNLLFGGPGDDVIRGADGADLCSGVSDDLDDLLEDLGLTDLGGAADLIFAGAGHDTVDAYDGIDFVFGSDGDDVLRADHGGIVIVPISGVPTPLALGNLMFGGDGEDAITSLGRTLLPTVPPFEIDLLFGGPCDDTISAGDGLNLVFGNRADDVITAGDGINLLFGNRGRDSLTAGDGLNVLFGNHDDDQLVAGSGVNVLVGNRGDDTLTAGAGLNIAFGNRGRDTVTGGPGVSVLFGNADEDDLTGGAGLTVAMGGRGNDRVRGGPGVGVLFGNADEDDLTGGAGLCVAFGNAGHDVVEGGAGLAVLFGNAGEDRLRSGPGLSVLFGNRDDDILVSGDPGLFIAFGNNDQDVIVGGAGLNLCFGNRGHDQFFGGTGTNLVFGNADNDIIRGGPGVDFLFGNRGNDTIAGLDGKDFIFGNADHDSLVTDGGGDYAFGNRGNDTVRSGNDDSTRDFLFGNRGNDALYGCSNADRLFGGRGNDSKNRNDCGGLSLPAPTRGEIRGIVLIDLDGDGFGDVGQAGVTVMAGAASAVTGADGRYRISGLAAGAYTVTQVVPAGFDQTSAPASYAVTVGVMGIDLFTGRDFVNLPQCAVDADGWGCLGNGCDPTTPGCQPVAVRPVLRCPETGAICDDADDCPCSDCVPSWEVVECACNPECYIILDPATGPQCSSCISGGQPQQCDLVFDGDVYRCVCPGCSTDLAEFTFIGNVTSISDEVPAPWNTVPDGALWRVTFRFMRNALDINPDPDVGDYFAIVQYELQIGAVTVSGFLPPPTTLIRNRSYANTADLYEVTIPVNGATFFLLLEDPTGTAWSLAGLQPRDRLPLCGDIVMSRFDARIFSLGVQMPGNSWQLSGLARLHQCTNCATIPPAPRAAPSRTIGVEPARLDSAVAPAPTDTQKAPPGTPVAPRRKIAP